MRLSVPSAVAAIFAYALLAACGIEQLSQGGQGKGGADGGSAGGGDASVTGLGCGTELQTGIVLCAATSMCPELVVDTQAFPSCGFRIRGANVDLVCGCGTMLCPMGLFGTCAQAAQLLASQTEQWVCTQVAEARCVEATNASASPSASPAPSCDRQCIQECGGGAGCAQVCNCP